MDIERLEKWHFEMTEDACDRLLKLTLLGKKKATSSSLPAYRIEGEPIPEKGLMSVVTDWKGHPRCVIRTTDVRVIPFKDIPFDLAKLEGEDETLESWKQTHEKFFREEGKLIGYPFSEEMEVVFEIFELVEIIADPVSP